MPKAKKKQEIFPQTLHVSFEDDGDSGFFLANKSMEALAEKNQTVEVAVYKLQKIVNVTLEVKTELKVS